MKGETKEGKKGEEKKKFRRMKGGEEGGARILMVILGMIPKRSFQERLQGRVSAALRTIITTATLPK